MQVSFKIKKKVLILFFNSKFFKKLFTYGPMAFYINGDVLQHYSSGILTLSTCSVNPVNHCVVLVGYGTENGQDYWRFQNSWNTNWGEAGFFRVKRGENACGIMTYGAFYITA